MVVFILDVSEENFFTRMSMAKRFTGFNTTFNSQVHIAADANAMGLAAGAQAGELIREAITARGAANIILATGTSQFSTLQQLIAEPGIDWSRVTMFHLDEYIGLPMTSPASFRKYLKERFVDQVPSLKAVHFINAEENAAAECERLNALIRNHPVDVALVGIGENGHLAFNDPPADFDTTDPYIIVELDEACRKQQYGEGWFATMEDVPSRAISMSIRQILASSYIICSVPDRRKAEAVRNSLTVPVDPAVPASSLRCHPACTFYLDAAAASLLPEEIIQQSNNI
jgi:glucosamine-6-phosphate deaminase